ncbi:AAA family ATPase [Mycobacterium sp. 134]|uniref:AAA family ATPase n=1 Tax=Mycobacterium sp. 134 TaxID=3400425 RepID=UPI003AAD8722
MLRRIDVKAPWRSLTTGFWASDFPLGKRTIVYGHNGSGKSTVSELLLSLADSSSATGVIWEDEKGHKTAVRTGGASPSPHMAVYTRRWVEENLSAFLDGASAAAIVTLGKEAIDAKDEEKRLVAEVERLQSEAREAKKCQHSAEKKLKALAKEVQERIISELQTFDYQHFTRSRYSIPKIEDNLRAYRGDFPDATNHTEALQRLGEAAPSAVAEVSAPPSAVVSDLAVLADLLSETPTRVAIAALENNSTAQAWVERGLDLHADSDECLFCAGAITPERRSQLARHFDESWLDIRGRATQLKEAVTREKKSLAAWMSSVPDSTGLASDLRAAYALAAERLSVEVTERVTACERVDASLDLKIADPSSTPEPPEWSVLSSSPTTTVLTQAISEHNQQVRDHAELSADRKKTVLDHIVGSQAEAFRDLDGQVTTHAATASASAKAAQLAEKKLDEVRQAKFTTKDMADTLTRDLARVYGKDHISVAVTADGKSYECRRGDQPGTDLSDGERTTLSLLYFLRNLEDQQTPGVDKAQRIVVIDDPSSSLDREALFATHQWLFDTLEKFGQYIALTHDFGLLRLFLLSYKGMWGKSMKAIRDQNPGELQFPRVAFLEVYASSADGERISKVGALPQVLVKNTSEYTYLFSMVMAGVLDSEDHDRLFLLPNAARRVLEIFASYKAPHRTDFAAQLEVLVQAQPGEPYRDVFGFCNKHSHGEGSESVDVLDARAVHGQIRRCMQFLRDSDPTHFERMCAAAGIDPTSLP